LIALLRTEFVKAFRRTRTLVVTLGLIGIPVLIVWAVHTDTGHGDRGEGGLFGIARASGLLVPAAVLDVVSALLLVVIAGMFAGDTVAGDASWGNLRYLLMRPVPRGRLLLAKVAVAATMIWACTILVTLAALVAGVVLFGVHPVTVPSLFGFEGFGGFTLSTGTLLARLGVAVAYVAFGFTALLAIGTFFSTITDSAASAIGATIGVYVVSEILNGIEQLRSFRYGLPTHYLSSWEPIFTENRYPKDMLVGVILQVVYAAVFGTAAFVWFKVKDIRS
jgi:ABC-2 type transport system permease protein